MKVTEISRDSKGKHTGRDKIIIHRLRHQGRAKTIKISRGEPRARRRKKIKSIFLFLLIIIKIFIG